MSGTWLPSSSSSVGKAQSSLCSGEPGPPSFIPRVKWSSDEHSSSSGIPYKTFSFRDWPWGLLLASFSVSFLLAGREWVSYAPSFQWHVSPQQEVTLSSYLIKKEAMRRELPRFPTVLGVVWLPWRVRLPTAAFSLCPESSLHIFHQRTDGYNSSHLATKTGPPSPSSHHLISVYFYRRIPQRRCLYIPSPCPTVRSHIFTQDTLLKVGCVYSLEEKRKKLDGIAAVNYH